MSSSRSWPLGLVLALWFALVVGAALISVPIIGLLSLVLVPLGAIGLAFAVVQGPEKSAPGNQLSVVSTLFLSGLAVYGALSFSWTLLAAQRASQPGGGAGTPTVEPSVWLTLAGLNLLGVAALVVGNELKRGADRRAGLPLTVLVGSTPAASLLCLLVASGGLPLTA